MNTLRTTFIVALTAGLLYAFNLKSQVCTLSLGINTSGNSANATAVVIPNGDTLGYFVWYLYGPLSNTGSPTSSVVTNVNHVNFFSLASGTYDLCVQAYSTSCSNNPLTACQSFTISSSSSFCIPTINVVSSSGSNVTFSLSAPVSNNAIFNWSWSGPSSGSITSGTTPTVNLNLSPNGVYWVCGWAVDTTVCNSYTLSCISVTIGITALFSSGYITDNINLYPVPFNDYLYISLPDENSYNICLVDVTGKKIVNEFSNGSHNKECILQLSALPKGIYTLTLYNDKAKFIRKIIKE